MTEFREIVHLAACSGKDINMFFPLRGESVKKAMSLCNECLIKEECKSAGLQEPFGIWGGLSGRGRYTVRNTKY